MGDGQRNSAVALHRPSAAPLAAAYQTELDRLHGLADGLVTVELHDLTDAPIRALLQRLQPSLTKLQALRTRGAGELERRAVNAAPAGRERRAEERSLHPDRWRMFT